VFLQPYEKYGIVYGVGGNKRTDDFGVLRQSAPISERLRSAVCEEFATHEQVGTKLTYVEYGNKRGVIDVICR